LINFNDDKNSSQNDVQTVKAMCNHNIVLEEGFVAFGDFGDFVALLTANENYMDIEFEKITKKEN